MHRQFRTLGCALLFVMAWLLTGHSAQAATTAPVPVSCSASSTTTSYGLTVSVMYCVEQSICNTLVGTNCDGSPATALPTCSATLTTSCSMEGGYLHAISTGLSSLLGASAVLAVTLFGLRLLTMTRGDLQNNVPLSEGAKLLFRMALAAYLVAEAPSLFLTFINSIGEMIGWVTGGNNGILASLATPACASGVIDPANAPPAGMDSGQYNVWSTYDCMLSSLVGATSSAKAISVSLGGLIFPALVSAIFLNFSYGIIIFCFSIAVIFFLFFVLMRALYVVLMSYVIIAFLMVLTPLFAPMLMFSSSYVSGLFSRWFFQIIGAVFQPVIIVTFVAFGAAVADQFIEGNLSGCVNGTPTSVCSYQQLLNSLPNKDTSALVDPNGVNVLEWVVLKDPQLGAQKYGIPSWLANLGSDIANFANYVDPQLVNAGFNWGAGMLGTPILPDLNLAGTNTTLFQQLGLLLGALLFVCFIFYTLMGTMMQVASQMTAYDPDGASVGLGIASIMLPLQGFVSAIGAGARDGMLSAAQGKSLLRGNVKTQDIVAIMRAGAVGGLRGALAAPDSSSSSDDYSGGGGDDTEADSGDTDSDNS